MTPSRRCDVWGPTDAPDRHVLVEGAWGGWLARLGDSLLDLAGARCCGACDGPAPGPLCAVCLEDCATPDGPCCLRCGGPRRKRPGCGRCARFGRPFRFDGAAALWSYEGPVRRVIHGAKFAGRREVLVPLGRRLARHPAVGAWCRVGAAPLVVAVPAHAASRRRRGYDQAHELARGLAREAGLTWVPGGLRRRREDAGTQARGGPAARRRGPRAAFRAEPGWVRGRRVLLVDDVLSTGATADAATRALRVAGAVAVQVAVLAT